MTPEEPNKVIAEFIGWELSEFAVVNLINSDLNDSMMAGKSYSLPTESLDTLVPVWEKLGINNIRLYENINSEMVCSFDIRKYRNARPGISKTFQQAAAIATSKAIQESKK